jgi:hypothetical protein
MATLTEAQLLEIGRLLRNRYSSEWQEMPFKKSQLHTFGVMIDGLLEQLEVDAASALPASALKSWLIAHDYIARDIIVAIATKRRETF